MSVTLLALNKLHPNTLLCTMGAERKRWGMEDEESHAGAETTFWALGHTLAVVTSFCYPVRVLTRMYDDWPAVFDNLQKDRQIW